MADQKVLMKHQAGFTLVELMITVAIVAIVSGIAIGGYLSWKPGYVFRGAVSQVRGDLNRAKMRAVETRRQCRVAFSTNGYQILDGNRIMNSTQWGNIAADGTFTGSASAPYPAYRTRDFNKYPQITLLDSSGTAIAAGSEIKITFSPRGTAGNNTVRVKHPSTAGADIAVNITGRINITWL